MKIFKKINKQGDPCMICGTKKDGQVTLILIDGTEEGNNIQAKQVHVECLDLRYDPIRTQMIYMKKNK